MAKKEGQAVKLAKLHQPVDVPGAFALEKSLNSKRIPGLKMSWDGEGLTITVKESSAYIPSPNIAVMVFE